MKTNPVTAGLKLLILGVLAVALVSHAALHKPPDKKQAATPQASTPKPQEPAKEPLSPVTAFVGARIHTITQGIIRQGTILVQDGKILRMVSISRSPRTRR